MTERVNKKQSFNLDEADLQTVSLNDAWVQCENPSCLKWRRISQEEVALLGTDMPWFCYMNSDVEHNQCDDVEEDYASEERRARKLGLQYVESCLAEGTLVWARMPGYCRWPAMVCRDPQFGVSIQRDCDGDVSHYHVEFLGRHHSRSWIRVKNVELYGFTKEKTEKKQDMITNKFSAKKRKKNMKISSAPRKATSYKRGSVDAAIEEANQLLEMLPKTRLERQHYKPELCESVAEQQEMVDPEYYAWLNRRIEHGSNNLPAQGSKDLHSGIYEFESETDRQAVKKAPNNSRKQRTFNTWKKFLHCGTQRQKYLERKKKFHAGVKQQKRIKTKKGPNTSEMKQKEIKIKSEPISSNESQLKAVDENEQNQKLCGLKKTCNPDAQISMADVLGCIEIVKVEPDLQAVKVEPESPSINKPVVTESNELKSPTPNTNLVDICSPMSDVAGKRQVLTKQLKESTSLVGRTKEEKFQLDIEMYRRNEKAFSHDVCRFMHRNGRKVKLTPVWQSVPISLFQLFLSVYERGGYHALSGKVRGGWEGVYREVTGVEKGGGMVAKKFYESNLLPYELYIAGYDTAHCFQGKKQRTCEPVPKAPVDEVTKQVDLCVAPSDADMSEIDQMLQELDHYDSQLNAEIKKASKESYLQVMFYDDSPSFDLASQNLRLADTASEFGQQAQSPEGAQEVTNPADKPVGGSNMKEDMHKAQNCGNIKTNDCGNDDSEQVLHEMETLQEELDQMNYHAQLSAQLNAT